MADQCEWITFNGKQHEMPHNDGICDVCGEEVGYSLNDKDLHRIAHYLQMIGEMLAKLAFNGAYSETSQTHAGTTTTTGTFSASKQ